MMIGHHQMMIGLTDSHGILGQYKYKGMPIGSAVFPQHVLDRVCKMELRADDVIILGYPKSGKPQFIHDHIIYFILSKCNTNYFIYLN